jgi:hypothetical protein
MTGEFITLMFWGGLIFVIAKAPKEFTMIMLALAWGGMFLAILWALGRLAYYLLFG